MFASRVVPVVLAAGIAATLAPARATAAPVLIETCSLLRALRGNVGAFNYYPYGFYGPYNGFPGGYPGYGAPVTDGIRIEYRNLSSKVADRVAFGVNYRGQRDVVVDTGTFSPNVTIDHTFGEFSGLAYLGNRPNSCNVLAVRYKNGSVYRAPGMAERPQAR